MSFKSEHPQYEGYQGGGYCLASVPPAMNLALQQFIIRHCEGEEALHSIINEIAERVPMETTLNCGWGFLVDELPYYVARLCSLPLHKVMDFLADICTDSDLSFFADDINELLNAVGVGYVLETDRWSSSASWRLCETTAAPVGVLKPSPVTPRRFTDKSSTLRGWLRQVFLGVTSAVG